MNRAHQSETGEDAAVSMSEHPRQTEFLRQCLLYDDTAESRLLGESIAQVQEDERRVRRGLCLMAGLAGLAVVGLCYSAVFLAYYPENIWGFTSRLVTQVFCALGLVATVCLLVFLYLGRHYRRELDEHREQCRQVITAVMESRLGKPVAPPSRVRGDIQAGAGDGRNIRVFTSEVAGPSGKIESAAQG